MCYWTSLHRFLFCETRVKDCSHRAKVTMLVLGWPSQSNVSSGGSRMSQGGYQLYILSIFHRSFLWAHWYLFLIHIVADYVSTSIGGMNPQPCMPKHSTVNHLTIFLENCMELRKEMESMSAHCAGGLLIESWQPTSVTNVTCRERDRPPCCIHTYIVYTPIGGKGRCHTRCDLQDHSMQARKSAGKISTLDLKPMRKDTQSPKQEQSVAAQNEPWSRQKF